MNVFPVRAGIFPMFPSEKHVPTCLPRFSGVLSWCTPSSSPEPRLSQRPLGSFRDFECHLERSSLPRECGDLSISLIRPATSTASSSPKRGSFFEHRVKKSWQSLPRACGDLSRGPWCHQRRKKSSPRQRGSFHRTDSKALLNQVFPARAGIVLEQKQAQKVH